MKVKVLLSMILALSLIMAASAAQADPGDGDEYYGPRYGPGWGPGACWGWYAARNTADSTARGNAPAWRSPGWRRGGYGPGWGRGGYGPGWGRGGCWR